MTSIIKLNVISGAKDDSPPCYILQIDDVRILLDCGWDEHFDQNFIKEISKNVKYIDVVLLSYPDPRHLGALPYLVGKCDLSCPIYATIPVYKMGQMFMYDLYQSRYNNEDFTVFNLDDVDVAFDKIIQLKYNQTVALKGKCHGLSIIPMPAGHIIGGTIWKIMKTEEEEIVYAIDFNHKKERHLNGCNFEKIQRPLLLITNSFNTTYLQERRRVRDERLMTNILQTLSNNGNVLIAIDTAGRILELAHMLDQLWGNKNSGLQNHSLCFLNNVSYNVIEFAKSQIEWMSDKLLKTFESVRHNPFQFKNIKLCHSLADISKIPNSKVVLASMSDLECGFARSLCLEWLPNHTNSIILTSRCRKGTLARELIDLSKDQKKIQISIKLREKLSGEELANYIKNQNKADSDSSDSDDLQILGNIRKFHDFVVKSEKTHRRKNRVSISRSYPIYPFEDIKKRYDEFGEVIDLSEFMQESKENCIDEDKMEEDITDIVECPTKCVSFNKDIDIKASVQFISFEGRSDGESLQKLITNARPRTVILIGAPAEETEILANHLKEKTDSNIFTPAKGEIVDATIEEHIYQIRLTDGLVSSLDLQLGDQVSVELAWVDSVAAAYTRNYKFKADEDDMIIIDDENGKDTTQETKNNPFLDKNDELMVLEPILDKDDITPHPTIFINEIKLSDLKYMIRKWGIDCEFSGGVLFCSNRTIAIRRENKRKITFEGILSEDYYKVRTILYGHFAIL